MASESDNQRGVFQLTNEFLTLMIDPFVNGGGYGPSGARGGPAALADLLHRAVENHLQKAGVDHSATAALNAITSVGVIDIDLGKKTTKCSVTRGSQRAAILLRALGVEHLEPPTPPMPGQTIK